MRATKFEMVAVKSTVGKMSESFSTIIEEGQSRERQFADPIIKLHVDIRTRDQRTEEKITRIEKNMDFKIEGQISAKFSEKFLELETKMEDMEKRLETATKTHEKDNTKEGSRSIPIEHKAVAIRFKEDRNEKEAKAMIEETIRVLGMKDMEYTIDCPATPITHAFVELQSERIRDRYVRAVSLRQQQLNGRAIKIPPAMDVQGRFQWKRLGHVNFVLNNKIGIPLNHIGLSQEKRIVVVDGPIVARVDESCELRCNKHHNIEEEVQDLMAKWLTKNSS